MASSRVTIDGLDHVRDDSKMDIIRFTDRGGNSIKFQIFEGTYYGAFYKPEDMTAMHDFQLRPDDVYFPAFPRTGTHWTFEMTCMLLNGNAETVQTGKTMRQLEVAIGNDFDSLPSPRVLNTHMRLSAAPKDLLRTKCKVIYNLRDPRDVAVSLYVIYFRMKAIWDYCGEFKDFFYLFLEGKVDCNGIFGHYRDAEKFMQDHPDIPVHIQIYEQTKKDPLREVQALSDFLGVKRDDDLCQRIADKCAFAKMAVDKEFLAVRHDNENVMFRKGEPGDWKNWFTEEMLEDYYKAWDEHMTGSKFYDRYSREADKK